MTTTSVRARRAAAAMSSGALALVALAAAPMAADAVSPSISYDCTAVGTTGSFPLPVILDTSLPERVMAGQSTQMLMTARALLSDAAVDLLAPGSTSVQASLKPRVSAGAFVAEPVTTVYATALVKDSNDAVLNGSSASVPFTAPATPGSLDVIAGGITGTLTFEKSGSPSTAKQVTCTVPNGKPPVVDTIAVLSGTTTTLTFARSTSAFGQGVAASAKVASPSGVPAGEVAFTMGTIVTRVKVDKDGVASLDLPDVPVGSYTAWATFVPSPTAAYVGSTSVTQLLTVSKAETKVRVPVTGKREGTVTRVGVKAKGAYDTVPTGKVKITLKRLGAAGRWARVRTLAGGSARVGFGSLKAGRYKAVVKYAGDASHLAAKKIATFRVKPG